MTQWTKLPPGASGSFITSAKLRVPAGGSFHESAGETSAPSHAKRAGISPLARKDDVLRINSAPGEAGMARQEANPQTPLIDNAKTNQRARRTRKPAVKSASSQSILSQYLLITISLLLGIPAITRSDPIAAAPQQGVPDMTGEYEFLKPENTLAILEEEGKLKGYIDVMQDEDESSDVLSYPITIGTRAGDRVEFKTAKIHEKYYRFKGSVARGKGRTPNDGDFLQLTGDVEVVTVDAAGQEHPEQHHVTFKWKPKSENDED